MSKKVLIIDDEPDIRAYLMAALEDEGFLAVSIQEGEDAVAVIEKEKPSLVILDIMMPGRSGISIYKELRSKSELSGVPIALISGMQTKHDFLEGGFEKMAGDQSLRPPDGYVEKPVQLPVFLDLVRKLTT